METYVVIPSGEVFGGGGGGGSVQTECGCVYLVYLLVDTLGRCEASVKEHGRVLWTCFSSV